MQNNFILMVKKTFVLPEELYGFVCLLIFQTGILKPGLFFV